jgi:arylformamidase
VDVRARFDADVTFVNGGSLSARDFRLDVDRARLTADDVGLRLVPHLGSRMVGEVRISRLRFVAEPHQGTRAIPPSSDALRLAHRGGRGT